MALKTKPGKYGTLTMFSVAFDDGPHYRDEWKTWAYDAEHAVAKFYDSIDGDTGYTVTGVKAVKL